MPVTHFFKVLAVILMTLIVATAGLAAPPGQLAEADGLLESPTLAFPQAQRALALYEGMVSSPPNTPAGLVPRLARVCFILGDMAPPGQRQGYYEKGLAYAQGLLREQPDEVAGHYWTALNLCGLADVGSVFRGRRLLPRILEELQRAVALDPAYDQAGAHRVLGRIYYEAPFAPLSVGDLNQSLRHLTAAVGLAPDNSTNHLYLAETLLRLGNPDQARRELERVLTSTRHAIHPQGLAEDRREARRLLAEGVKGQN